MSRSVRARASIAVEDNDGAGGRTRPGTAAAGTEPGRGPILLRCSAYSTWRFEFSVPSDAPAGIVVQPYSDASACWANGVNLSVAPVTVTEPPVSVRLNPYDPPSSVAIWSGAPPRSDAFAVSVGGLTVRSITKFVRSDERG